MNLPATKPSRSSTTDVGGRTIKLAPLGCPYCQRELRIHDIELLSDGDVRFVCAGCHADTLLIEWR